MFEHTEEEFSKTRQGFLFTYVQIAFNQSMRFVNLMEPAEESGWMLYTQDDQLEAARLECRIVAALTTALFLEAYIYDYGARKESASFVDNYLDKLDPVAKWVVVPRLVAPPGLDRGDEVFERLRRLFKIRNDLIHNKTKPSEDFATPPDFPDGMEPNECVALIADLLKKLHELDPTEIFAEFVLRHIDSWIQYSSRNSRFYPILWEVGL